MAGGLLPAEQLQLLPELLVLLLLRRDLRLQLVGARLEGPQLPLPGLDLHHWKQEGGRDREESDIEGRSQRNPVGSRCRTASGSVPLFTL